MRTKVIEVGRGLFDRWETYAHTRRAMGLMFIWAFAEAVWWPVVPEALLLPLALGGRRAFWRLLLASALGSAAGGTLLYLLTYLRPDAGAALLPHLPLFSEARQSRVEGWLGRYGARAFLAQPYSGIDFKFFGVAGAMAGIPPWTVIPLSLVARAARMLASAGLVWLSGRYLRRYYRDFFLPVAMGYVVLFAYNWYLVQFRM
ncbi:MAG: hypothetical protein HY683_08860 [Chloroflexi bacterium]|nr:hypothetical protein [Chloroflexota bacterium]